MTHAGVLKTDGSRSESAHGSKLLAYLLLPVVWPPTPVWMSACWLINAITRRAALLSGLRAPPSPHFLFSVWLKEVCQSRENKMGQEGGQDQSSLKERARFTICYWKTKRSRRWTRWTPTNFSGLFCLSLFVISKLPPSGFIRSCSDAELLS